MLFRSFNHDELIVWQPLLLCLFGVVFCSSFAGPVAFYWWPLWLVPLYFASKQVLIGINKKKIHGAGEPQPHVMKTREFQVDAPPLSPDWINDIVKNVWETNEVHFVNYFMQEGQKMLQENLPPVVRALTLEKISLGTQYPKLSQISIHNQEPSHFFIEGNMDWLSDLRITCNCDCGTLNSPLVIDNMSIISSFRIHVWLLDHHPYISHCKFSLIDPLIDMNVQKIGRGPDVRSVIKSMMVAIIRALVVSPNFYELILNQTPSDMVPTPVVERSTEVIQQRTDRSRAVKDKILRQVHPNGTNNTAFNNQPKMAKEAAASRSRHIKTKSTENPVVIHNNTAATATAPKFSVKEAPSDCQTRTSKGQPVGLGVDLDKLENKYSAQENASLQPRKPYQLQRSHSDRSHKKHFRHFHKFTNNFKA